MTQKNDNRSLIMYTSLIFVAAVIMIVVSHFADSHWEQTALNQQLIEAEAETVSLSNKAAQVSEINMQLSELNAGLKNINKELVEQNTALSIERDANTKEIAGYKALIEVYEKLIAGKKNTAKTLLKNIFTEDLTQQQKEIYDFLVKKTD